MTQPTDVAPVVSVVIPSGRPAVVGGQLRALAEQDLRDRWELIIVTAEPAKLPVQQPLAKACALRVVTSSTPLDPAAARNLGVAHARAPLLAFCDDDDEVCPGWLTAIVTALRAVDVVAGAAEVVRLNDARVVRAYGVVPLEVEVRTVGGWLPFAGGGNFAVRRSAFDAVEGFDERFRTAEDRDLSVRLQLAGHQLAFVPDALVHRRLRSSTKDIAVQAHRWAQGEVLLYREHRDRGLPGSEGVRAWARLARDVPQLLSSDTRASWLRRLAECGGRISGSVRYRTWYL